MESGFPRGARHRDGRKPARSLGLGMAAALETLHRDRWAATFSTMLIVCPKCSASYEVKAEAIGDKGRTVRCVHCRTEWFVTAPLVERTEVIGATEVETPVDSALAPTMVAAVADHPPPTQAMAED